jgi:hypothetical protein
VNVPSERPLILLLLLLLVEGLHNSGPIVGVVGVLELLLSDCGGGVG